MIGVIVPTFRSADVIENCLESLRKSEYSQLRVVVCDNNSPDGTAAIVREWARAQNVTLVEIEASPTASANAERFILLHTGANMGFAGAVNAGLSLLLEDQHVEMFWILNPDCEVTPGSAGAFARRATEVGTFALMGGRVCYREPPQQIQSDGGRISRWSGICQTVNDGRMRHDTVAPDVGSLDFISGASMVASRYFVEHVGLMVEDYFLYYEEVDWAARRGDLPLVWCPEAEVYHHGGTAIGSGSVTRRASPFANYFNYRNRIRFMRRFRPSLVPVSWGLSMLRVFKLVGLGSIDEAWGAFCGLNGLPPPTSIRIQIAPTDQERAFVLRDNTK